MKRRRCWRYQCDHCKKAGCSGGHIARHERACTANPNRVCRMCALVGETHKPMTELFAPIATAVEFFTPKPGEPDEIDVRGLRELTKNCPACILAALRQFKHPTTGENISASVDFDFKAECKVWLEQYRRSCNSTYPDGEPTGTNEFDRGEWLATWRACLPVEKPLRVNLVMFSPDTGAQQIMF